MGSNTYTGSIVINNTITIPSGTLATLQGEFMFAPNSKIVVKPGASLYINNSHLYACAGSMWEGIDIADGGFVNLDPGNLIEDAKVAINAVDQFTSTTVAAIVGSVFNKNHTDIKITKANCSGGSPLLVRSSVFTCRDLPYTSTTWPNTGMANTTACVNAELRYANPTATNGLSSPYTSLAAFTYTTLKSPFTSQTSHTAVVILDVGVTTNTAFYGLNIGSVSSSPPTADFNLFDAHGAFIQSTNSNLSLLNNVYQNTVRFAGTVGSGIAIVGGSAVSCVNNLLNAALTMSASSTSLGNRFWNVHTAVNGQNLLRFYLKNATLRSAQTTTNITGQQGERGLVLTTNRYQYFITDNEFTNIANCINVPIASGQYSASGSGTTTGIYADRIIIEGNVFSGTGSSSYINYGVNISCANFIPANIAANSTISAFPYPQGIVINNNRMLDVFRAVNINGIHSVRTSVCNNIITLKDDNVFSGTQRAISVGNTYGHAYVNLEQIVSNNTISAQSKTLSTQALVFCGNNLGVMSPSVTCNRVSNCYQGFVFAGMNGFANFPLRGALWLGNHMQDHKRGMTLLNFGVIKQQGTANEGMGNRWDGTWALGATPDYGIYTSISTASYSPLWYDANNSTSIPQNLFGNPFIDSYAVGSLSITNTSSEYGCSLPANHTTNQTDPHYPSDNVGYIFTLGQYQSLTCNDSLRINDVDLSDFYTGLATSSYANFENAALRLYAGDYASARSYLNLITASNDVESNYLSLYTLYANFLEANSESLSSEDSTALLYLSQLCPEDQGSCVYLARALYNRIYAVQIIGDPCEQDGEGRAAPPFAASINSDRSLALDSNIKIYPVPTEHTLQIEASGTKAFTKIEVYDLTNRCVLNKQYTATNTTQLLFDLPAGCYFIFVSNNSGLLRTQKIIITD